MIWHDIKVVRDIVLLLMTSCKSARMFFLATITQQFFLSIQHYELTTIFLLLHDLEQPIWSMTYLWWTIFPWLLMNKARVSIFAFLSARNFGTEWNKILLLLDNLLEASFLPHLAQIILAHLLRCLLGSFWPGQSSFLCRCADTGVLLPVVFQDNESSVCAVAIIPSGWEGVTCLLFSNLQHSVFSQGVLDTFLEIDLERDNCLSCCQLSSVCFPTKVRSIWFDWMLLLLLYFNNWNPAHISPALWLPMVAFINIVTLT